MYNLQYFLHHLINSAKAMREIMTQSTLVMDSLPVETMKMSMTIIVTGPIILLYPFIQKYFVSGLTIGAVKG
jgi:putative aldouronate transport system permease protein